MNRRHANKCAVKILAEVSLHQIYLVYLDLQRCHWPAKVIEMSKKYSQGSLITVQFYVLIDKHKNSLKMDIDLTKTLEEHIIPFQSVYLSKSKTNFGALLNQKKTQPNNKLEVAMKLAVKDYEKRLKTPNMYSQLLRQSKKQNKQKQVKFEKQTIYLKQGKGQKSYNYKYDGKSRVLKQPIKQNKNSLLYKDSRRLNTSQKGSYFYNESSKGSFDKSNQSRRSSSRLLNKYSVNSEHSKESAYENKFKNQKTIKNEGKFYIQDCKKRTLSKVYNNQSEILVNQSARNIQISRKMRKTSQKLQNQRYSLQPTIKNHSEMLRNTKKNYRTQKKQIQKDVDLRKVSKKQVNKLKSEVNQQESFSFYINLKNQTINQQRKYKNQKNNRFYANDQSSQSTKKYNRMVNQLKNYNQVENLKESDVEVTSVRSMRSSSKVLNRKQESNWDKNVNKQNATNKIEKDKKKIKIKIVLDENIEKKSIEIKKEQEKQTKIQTQNNFKKHSIHRQKLDNHKNVCDGTQKQYLWQIIWQNKYKFIWNKQKQKVIQQLKPFKTPKQSGKNQCIESDFSMREIQSIKQEQYSSFVSSAKNCKIQRNFGKVQQQKPFFSSQNNVNKQLYRSKHIQRSYNNKNLSSPTRQQQSFHSLIKRQIINSNIIASNSFTQSQQQDQSKVTTYSSSNVMVQNQINDNQFQLIKMTKNGPRKDSMIQQSITMCELQFFRQETILALEQLIQMVMEMKKPQNQQKK